MLKSTLGLLVFLIVLNQTIAQSWMGERITNTAAFMDPTEVQMSGSITSVMDQGYSSRDYQFLPFGIGGSQSIYANKEKSWEFFGELACFTQFEWLRKEGKQERNLYNIDYRIAFSLVKEIRRSSYRLRFFHVSSHLGDDYLIRNKVRSYSENTVNYEQLDFTYFYALNKQTRFSAGSGFVVRPNSPRAPLSMWFSFDQTRIKESANWGFCYGFNFKTFQETNFYPNRKIAAGFAFKRSTQEPMRLVLEYYKGHLPYSQFEQSQLEWLGLGLYFYLQ